MLTEVWFSSKKFTENLCLKLCILAIPFKFWNKLDLWKCEVLWSSHIPFPGLPFMLAIYITKQQLSFKTLLTKLKNIVWISLFFPHYVVSFFCPRTRSSLPYCIPIWASSWWLWQSLTIVMSTDQLVILWNICQFEFV